MKVVFTGETKKRFGELAALGGWHHPLLPLVLEEQGEDMVLPEPVWKREPWVCWCLVKLWLWDGSHCRTVTVQEEQMPTLLPSLGLLQVHPFGQIQPGVGGIQSMELRRKRTEQVGEAQRTDLPWGAKGDDAAPHYSASSPSGHQTGPRIPCPFP